MSAHKKAPSCTRKLLVGYDFEPDGDVALDAALDQAAMDPGAEVHVLFVDVNETSTRHVGDAPPKQRILAALENIEKRIEPRLAEARRRHPQASFRRVIVHFRAGAPAPIILELAVELDADLIVVGTHDKKGLRHLVLGSVAEDVVHHATCPVFVARNKAHPAAESAPVPVLRWLGMGRATASGAT